MAEKAEHRILSLPVVVIGAVPQRLTVNEADITILAKAREARSVFIEAGENNTGTVFMAQSEAAATTTRRHHLLACESFEITPDDWGDLKGFLDLTKIWIHGDVASDIVVITFIDISEI